MKNQWIHSMFSDEFWANSKFALMQMWKTPKQLDVYHSKLCNYFNSNFLVCEFCLKFDWKHRMKFMFFWNCLLFSKFISKKQLLVRISIIFLLKRGILTKMIKFFDSFLAMFVIKNQPCDQKNATAHFAWKYQWLKRWSWPRQNKTNSILALPPL